MKALVTAGPTREAIDPVRYLGNRSSGRMGYAIAEALAKRGCSVELVSGPVSLPPPATPGITRTAVESAEEMYEAVANLLPGCALAIFAAAVADYRPVSVASEKLKKQPGSKGLVLELETTPDILGSARASFGFEGFLVGFAAETENLEEHAREKLTRKDCDLIVANDVSEPGIGFDAEENAVTLLFRDGGQETWPRARKQILADKLVAQILKLAQDKP